MNRPGQRVHGLSSMVVSRRTISSAYDWQHRLAALVFLFWAMSLAENHLIFWTSGIRYASKLTFYGIKRAVTK